MLTTLFPCPTMLRGDDIAVGDVILDVWNDAIEMFVVDEVTVDPDPSVMVAVVGHMRMAWNDGNVSDVWDGRRRWFGKASHQPVVATFLDCTHTL